MLICIENNTWNICQIILLFSEENQKMKRDWDIPFFNNNNKMK